MSEFINDLINFLFNYFRVRTTDEVHLRSYKRSLVRRIGSSLPIKPPPRMRIPLKIRESLVNNLLKKRLEFDESPTSSGSKTMTSSTLQKPDFLLDVYRRTQEYSPIKQNHQGEEILSLQQKVQMLEELVNKILLSQNSTIQAISSDSIILPNQSPCPSAAQSKDVGERSGVFSLPPPPPPPPPPGLFEPTNKLVISKGKPNPLKGINAPSRPSMGEVLKDMNKIKLRHVERSPGGGPIKRQADPNSPGGCLAAVLRKRFEAIQTKADDSFGDDCDSDDSLNSFKSSKTEASH